MIVNQGAVDWLTLTSYEEKFPLAVKAFCDKQEGMVAKRQERSLGYMGTRVVFATGSVFLGGNNAGHMMLVASGEIADVLFRNCDLQHLTVRCTRMDIQVTVLEPKDWSQEIFSRAVSDSGRFEAHSYLCSKTGQTVYLGSRKSDTFVRVYEKKSGDAGDDAGGDTWIRYEIEYKGDRANALYKRIGDGAVLSGFLVDSVQRVSAVYPDIAGLFLPALGGYPPNRVRLVKELGNTERWLLNQVFPALEKALSGHNGQWVRDWLLNLLGGDSEPVT